MYGPPQAPAPLTVAPPTGTPWTVLSGPWGPLEQVWNFWTSEPQLRRGVILAPPAPEMLMFTDASLYEWGAHVDKEDLSATGTWTEEESHLSIYILEMKDVNLGMEAFQSTLRRGGGKCITCSLTILRNFSETGGDTFGHFVPINVGPVSALCPSEDRAVSASHPREEVHPSGCPVLGRLSCPDRMYSSSRWGSVPCWDVGRSHGRFVRHQAEQATSPVLLPPPPP
jgi:hypothetical protein